MIDIYFIATIIGIVADSITIYLAIKEKKNKRIVKKSKICIIAIFSLAIIIGLSLMVMEGIDKDITCFLGNNAAKETSVETKQSEDSANKNGTINNVGNNNQNTNLQIDGENVDIHIGVPENDKEEFQYVIPVPTVSITFLELNKENCYLQPGQSIELKCTALGSDNLPVKNIVWNLTDSDVAKIEYLEDSPEKAVITALKTGKTKVIAQIATKDDTQNISCEIIVRTVPTGYTISISKDCVRLYEVFRITIIPKEGEDVKEVIAYAKSPSGKITHGEPCATHDGIEYWLVDAEYGEWEFYAELKNEVGTYIGTEGEEVVNIELIPY